MNKKMAHMALSRLKTRLFHRNPHLMNEASKRLYEDQDYFYSDEKTAELEVLLDVYRSHFEPDDAIHIINFLEGMTGRLDTSTEIYMSFWLKISRNPNLCFKLWRLGHFPTFDNRTAVYENLHNAFLSNDTSPIKEMPYANNNEKKTALIALIQGDVLNDFDIPF